MRINLNINKHGTQPLMYWCLFQDSSSSFTGKPPIRRLLKDKNGPACPPSTTRRKTTSTRHSAKIFQSKESNEAAKFNFSDIEDHSLVISDSPLAERLPSTKVAGSPIIPPISYRSARKMRTNVITSTPDNLHRTSKRISCANNLKISGSCLTVPMPSPLCQTPDSVFAREPNVCSGAKTSTPHADSATRGRHKSPCIALRINPATPQSAQSVSVKGLTDLNADLSQISCSSGSVFLINSADNSTNYALNDSSQVALESRDVSEMEISRRLSNSMRLHRLCVSNSIVCSPEVEQSRERDMSMDISKNTSTDMVKDTSLKIEEENCMNHNVTRRRTRNNAIRSSRLAARVIEVDDLPVDLDNIESEEEDQSDTVSIKHIACVTQMNKFDTFYLKISINL